jgi:hypothetical protein
MTKALVCVDSATYGGVYYCSDFTITGAQPVWSRLTTTGLPNTKCKIFGVDPADPINKQYVAVEVGTTPYSSDSEMGIYYRDGGNWSLILSTATMRTVTSGDGNTYIYWLWIDPTNGNIFVSTNYDAAVVGTIYVLKSTNHGASWTFSILSGNARLISQVNAIGNYVCASYQRGITRRAYVRYSIDGGSSWIGDLSLDVEGAGLAEININQSSPIICYARGNNLQQDLVKITYSAGAITKSTVYAGIASTDYLAGLHFIDPDAAGREVYLKKESQTPDIYRTTDSWAASATTTILSDSTDRQVFVGSQNDSSTGFLMGDSTIAASSHVYYVSSEADTGAEDRSGANAAAPYTDSLPNEGGVSYYGIWFGELPSASGVHVFSVEEDDITDIYYHDGLGIPMFGDRSSWRDYDADDDGTDAATPLSYYHAEDIRDEQPQRHNPWPAASGTAPVSDGSKWVATDVVTQAEMHDPVTLDADAAAIMDLQGGGQEIGLDTQTANTVFAGPAAGAANEPTFRVLVVADLPSEVIIESEAHEHIINEDHTAECDGAETGFPTLLNFRSGSTQVYLNGIRQRLDTHYTEDGTLDGITFDTAPEAGDELIIDYIVTWSDYQAQAALLLDSDSVGLQDSDEENLADSTA